jgi:hypothetical protein
MRRRFRVAHFSCAALLAGTCRIAMAAGEASEDIRDIRGPKLILPGWLVAAAIGGVLLIALLGFLLWRRLRRRRARVLLPFEVALARLEEIRPMMEPARAREFSIAVSDIVRTYIERRFAVTATHQTTEEFLHDLLESPESALLRHRGLLSEFLHQCDLVKFAGLSLTLQNMESLHLAARSFVLETSKPEPEADAAPGARASAVAGPSPVAPSEGGA